MTPDQLRQILLSPARLDTLWGLRCPSRLSFDASNSTNTSHQIVPFNKDRIGLIFLPPATGRVTLTNEDTAVLDQGLTIAAGSQPLYLRVKDAGLCVQKNWNGISAAASQILSWIEVMRPPAD